MHILYRLMIGPMQSLHGMCTLVLLLESSSSNKCNICSVVAVETRLSPSTVTWFPPNVTWLESSSILWLVLQSEVMLFNCSLNKVSTSCISTLVEEGRRWSGREAELWGCVGVEVVWRVGGGRLELWGCEGVEVVWRVGGGRLVSTDIVVEVDWSVRTCRTSPWSCCSFVCIHASYIDSMMLSWNRTINFVCYWCYVSSSVILWTRLDTTDAT